MANEKEREDYIRFYGWLAKKQGTTRGARESREEFVLRLTHHALCILFPDEVTDPVRRRYRSKMQLKPGGKSICLWNTGGLKQERKQKR